MIGDLNGESSVLPRDLTLFKCFQLRMPGYSIGNRYTLCLKNSTDVARLLDFLQEWERGSGWLTLSGEDWFYPSRRGGIRIRETSLRFPNSWAGGKINPPRGKRCERESDTKRVGRFMPKGRLRALNPENAKAFSGFRGAR